MIARISNPRQHIYFTPAHSFTLLHKKTLHRMMKGFQKQARPNVPFGTGGAAPPISPDNYREDSHNTAILGFIHKKSTYLSIRAWSRRGFAMLAGYKQKNPSSIG